MLTSAVIPKQRVLHEKEAVQLFLTANTMALVKAVLEDSYRVLPRT